MNDVYIHVSVTWFDMAIASDYSSSLECRCATGSWKHTSPSPSHEQSAFTSNVSIWFRGIFNVILTLNIVDLIGVKLYSLDLLVLFYIFSLDNWGLCFYYLAHSEKVFLITFPLQIHGFWDFQCSLWSVIGGWVWLETPCLLRFVSVLWYCDIEYHNITIDMEPMFVIVTKCPCVGTYTLMIPNIKAPLLSINFSREDNEEEAEPSVREKQVSFGLNKALLFVNIG